MDTETLLARIRELEERVAKLEARDGPAACPPYPTVRTWWGTDPGPALDHRTITLW